MVISLTLPSVTVRSVWMTDSLTSKFGVSSRNPITVWTIFVTACLSWPCFLDSRSTWSFSRFQSPEFLLSVTMVIRMRDVVARSEACRMGKNRDVAKQTREGPYLSCLLLQYKELVNGTLDIGLLTVSNSCLQN